MVRRVGGEAWERGILITEGSLKMWAVPRQVRICAYTSEEANGLDVLTNIHGYEP